METNDKEVKVGEVKTVDITKEEAKDFQKTASDLTGFDKELFATQDELDTGTRYFEADYKKTPLKLSVRKPTNSEVEKGDWEYSKYFNRAITAGIAPQSAVLSTLKENGSWTEEDDNMILSLSENVADLELEIEKIDSETRDYKKLLKTREQLRETRKELKEQRERKQSYLFHTAEQKCEDYKTRVIVSLVTEYASGPKKGLNFFKDHYKNGLHKSSKNNSKIIEEFEAFQAFDDQTFTITCYINYLTLINGLAANFLEREMIENKSFDWEDSAIEELNTKKSKYKK